MSDLPIPNHGGKGCDLSSETMRSVFKDSGWHILSVSPKFRTVGATQYKLNGIIIFKELSMDADMSYELHVAGQLVPQIYKIRIENADHKTCLSEKFDLKKLDSLKEFVHVVTSLDVCTGYDCAAFAKGSAAWSSVSDENENALWKKRSAKCEGLLAGGSRLSSCKECLREKATTENDKKGEQQEMQTDQPVESRNAVEQIWTAISCECMAGVTLRKLCDLWQQQALCDVTFVFKGDTTLMAHKIVLAATSDYFRQMQLDRGIPSLIYLSWCNKDSAVSIMNFFYGRGLEVTAQNVEELHKLGTVFNMSNVLEMCSRFKSVNMLSNVALCQTSLSSGSTAASTGIRSVALQGKDVPNVKIVNCQENGESSGSQASTALWNVKKGIVFPGVKREPLGIDHKDTPVICNLYSSNLSTDFPLSIDIETKIAVSVLEAEMSSSRPVLDDVKENIFEQDESVPKVLKPVESASAQENECSTIQPKSVIKENTKKDRRASQKFTLDTSHVQKAVVNKEIETKRDPRTVHPAKSSRQFSCFVCKTVFPHEVSLYRHFWQTHSVSAGQVGKTLYEMKREPADSRQVLVGSCCVGRFKSRPTVSKADGKESLASTCAPSNLKKIRPGIALQKASRDSTIAEKGQEFPRPTSVGHQPSGPELFLQGDPSLQGPKPISIKSTAAKTSDLKTTPFKQASKKNIQLVKADNVLPNKIKKKKVPTATLR